MDPTLRRQQHDQDDRDPGGERRIGPSERAEEVGRQPSDLGGRAGIVDAGLSVPDHQQPTGGDQAGGDHPRIERGGEGARQS